MNVLPIDQLSSIQVADNKQSPDAMRRAATEFEAMFLRQLTAALNPTSDDDEGGEEKLFGSDGGTGLAKQMFSEQLANTMAQSGGVGISDLILSKLGVDKLPNSGRIKGLSEAITAIKDIKESRTSAKSLPLIDRSAKAYPLTKQAFTGDPSEAQIVSTFEDEARAEGIDASLENLILNGKIVNTTRPRIAPNEPIREVRDISTVPSVDAAPTNVGPVAYQYPVAGRLSSGFGNRFHPIDKMIKFHAGLDLAVPLGTPVGAAANGVVKFAGRDGGYGNLVIIQHPDGKETRYGHLSKILVAQNDNVSAGQQIALSGSTGKSTGPHVHFEVRENGQVV
ncbi:MAG TPA: peptidoglycan DD-metalloendopeptidase family protein, partial [Pyrinomonadaceae bacterium]|nr:peptidoglycan DD-metalloendopeptidase family protein [Pyrinomonadaceae bacterium]